MPAHPLDDSIVPGQTGHIADSEELAAVHNVIETDGNEGDILVRRASADHNFAFEPPSLLSSPDEFNVSDYYTGSWFRAIELAGAAADANGGGTVILPSGTLTDVPNPTPPSPGGSFWSGAVWKNFRGVSLQGQGEGTTVLAIDNAGFATDPSACMTIAECDDFYIDGVSFTTINKGNPRAGASALNLSLNTNFEVRHCEVTNWTIFGMGVFECEDGRIHDNHVHDGDADGIHLQQGNMRVLVDHNHVHDTGDDCIAATGEVAVNEDVRIIYNDCHNSGAGGISSHGNKRLRIEHNMIRATAGNGVPIGAVIAPSEDIFVRYNTLEDIGSEAAGPLLSGLVPFGIHGELNDPNQYLQTGIHIEGNTLRRCRNGFISVGEPTIDSKWGQVVIRDNHLFGPIVTNAPPTGVTNAFNKSSITVTKATDLLITGNDIHDSYHAAIFTPDLNMSGPDVVEGIDGPLVITDNKIENGALDPFSPWDTAIQCGSGERPYICDNLLWGDTLPTSFLSMPVGFFDRDTFVVDRNDNNGAGFFNCLPVAKLADPFVVPGKLVVTSGYPWLDVQKYDINLNGAVDNTTELNDALVDAAAVGIHGGSVLRLPPGQIRVDGQVLWQQGVMLEAAGPGATSILSNYGAGAAVLFPASCSKAGMKDLQIILNDGSGSVIGVQFDKGQDRVRCENVEVLKNGVKVAGQRGWLINGGDVATLTLRLLDCAASNCDTGLQLVNTLPAINPDALAGVWADAFFVYNATHSYVLNGAIQAVIKGHSIFPSTRHVWVTLGSERNNLEVEMLGGVIPYTIDLSSARNKLFYSLHANGFGETDAGTDNKKWNRIDPIP